MKYLATGIVAFLVLVGGILFGHSITPSSPSFSSTAFTPVSGKTYYLAGAGVTSSANTITLSSFTLPDPNNTPIQSSMYSGTQYGVLEAQTSKTEDITFTGDTQNANGTATLTGVTRGISFYSPFVASTTLQLAHAGGATFILSNPAAFYAQFLTANNNASIESLFTFSSTSPPVYDADPIWANFSTQALADVSYVNSVVAAGCANASLTVKGCLQIATQIQSASSTASGSTGALLVGNNAYSTSTPGTAGLWNVWTQNDGKIATTFLNGLEAYIFNGLTTFNAGFIDNASSTFTSTVNLNGTTLLNGVSVTPKFGGNGALGALNISSGTTTISLANAKYAEFDYTSISITGTGNLTFSNPASGGSFIVLRSQGNVTITCTDQFCIDVTGLGGGGGAGGGSGATSGTAGTGGNAFFLFTTSGGAAGSSGGGSPAGGATPTAIAPSSWLSSNYATSTLMKYGGQFWVGGGGGGGGTGNASNNATQGAGGTGSGSLLMEVGGALNLTATNGINAVGGAGINPTNTTYGGAGGGGAGGLVKVLYNTLTANTGTIVVSGGAGGAGGSNSGASCGAGGGTAYTAGNAGATGSSCTGGLGASGASSVEQNTNFY